MTREDALQQVLRAYIAYYNITEEDLPEAFAAKAVFSFHDEQYVLIKKAKISEADSREYVYFAIPEVLDEAQLVSLAALAWEQGLSEVDPGPNHRNSDISLVVLTDSMTSEAAVRAKKLKYSKNYMHGLRGWSNFRLVVYDLTHGTAAHNRLGADMKKTICNIFGSI